MNKTIADVEASTDGVRAVDRAMHVLFAIADRDRPASLAQLARRTGFHKSTILRLMGSLVRAGLVVRRPDGNYELGQRLPVLSGRYATQVGIGREVPKSIDELVERTGHTASFFVPDGNARLCLFRKETYPCPGAPIEVGSRLPLEVGAPGHVIRSYLAHGPAASPNPQTTYADTIVSHGEWHPDLVGIAVPVFKDGATFAGALNVSGLQDRLSGSAVESIRVLIADVAANLSSALARLAARRLTD